MMCCDLVVEIMGRHSNIILVDESNMILESVKRVPPQLSRRVILPRHAYESPPPQSKQNPQTAQAETMQALVTTSISETNLSRALVQHYLGISPQVAREVIYRAMGTAEALVADNLPWQPLATCLREIVSEYQPCLVQPANDLPLAYAPYHLTHLADAQPQETIQLAMERFYAAREHLTAHRQRRDAVQQQLDAARSRLQQQEQQIRQELERAQGLEQVREEGEMILAFLHLIEPGQTRLSVEGLDMTLDPNLSPVENAQRRFRSYHKARSALEGLPTRLEQTTQRLEGLEQLATLLELADRREQIDQIAQEAEEQGYLAAPTSGRKQRSKPVRVKPLRLLSSDGYDIYVGRSATQNVEVTFQIGRPEDIWLHVRMIPGAHVIIRTHGRDVPERTLREAAAVAAYFSRARNEDAVDVDVSRRTLVRKIPGAAPGLVTYRAEQTVRVAPMPPWS